MCDNDGCGEKIPDFGPKADAAVKAACALFPPTFRLRNHEGMFRVSESASYVSQGRVMVYTQRYLTHERFMQVYGRPHRTPEELWVDFAKGTVGELQSQIRY